MKNEEHHEKRSKVTPAVMAARRLICIGCAFLEGDQCRLMFTRKLVDEIQTEQGSCPQRLW